MRALRFLVLLSLVASGGAGAATIVVATNSVGIGEAQCTLRDAILAANTNAPSGACAAGDGTSDTIELPPGATFAFTIPTWEKGVGGRE